MSVNPEAHRPVTDCLGTGRKWFKMADHYLKVLSCGTRRLKTMQECLSSCMQQLVRTSGSLGSLTPAYVMPEEFPHIQQKPPVATEQLRMNTSPGFI